MIIFYKGEKLKYINNFYEKQVLWITEPHQRDMELMKFVGGYPNEYCIYLDNISLDDYQYIKPDLSQYPTLKFLYFTKHKVYGYSFVCSEKINGVWKDGYYIIDNNENFVRQGNAR